MVETHGDIEIGHDYVKIGDGYIIDPSHPEAVERTKFFRMGFQLGDTTRVRKIKIALDIDR